MKISNDAPSRQVTMPDYVKAGMRDAAPPDRPSTLTIESVMRNDEPYHPTGGLGSLREAMAAMKATRSLILAHGK